MLLEVPTFLIDLILTNLDLGVFRVQPSSSLSLISISSTSESDSDSGSDSEGEEFRLKICFFYFWNCFLSCFLRKISSSSRRIFWIGKEYFTWKLLFFVWLKIKLTFAWFSSCRIWVISWLIEPNLAVHKWSSRNFLTCFFSKITSFSSFQRYKRQIEILLSSARFYAFFLFRLSSFPSISSPLLKAKAEA